MMPSLVTPAALNTDGLIVLFGIATSAAIIALVLTLIETRKRLAVSRKHAALVESKLGEVGESINSGSHLRESVVFEQHKRMNELQIAKLTAEVELLQRQLHSRGLEEDRIEAGREYHELMVEKTKLEMDSLRLHIAELRKRMEDWRFGND